MTDHSALIAGLEFLATFGGEHGKRYADAAAALREQAGEIERLEKRQQDWYEAEAKFYDLPFEKGQRESSVQTLCRDLVASATERDTLASENAGLKKDAERYRYFRAFKIMPIDIEAECRKRGLTDITPNLLDEIIDAAMKP